MIRILKTFSATLAQSNVRAEIETYKRKSNNNNNDSGNQIKLKRCNENKAAYARINMIGDRVWKAPTAQQS